MSAPHGHGGEPGTARIAPLTRHAEDRMRQRAYRDRDVELIVAYGRETGRGHMLLLRKDVEHVRREAKRLLDRLDHLEGSAVLRGEDGAVLSVYRPDKVRRRKLLKGAA